MNSFLKMCAAMFMAALLAASALAAPSYCNTGPGDLNPAVNTNGQAITDVKIGGINATNCYGVVAENDDLAAITAIWGAGLGFAARDNNGGGGDVSNTVDGITWSIAAAGNQSGTFTLIGLDVNGGVPANLGDMFDLALVTKAGNEFATYMFSNFTFDGSENGTFQITYTNNGNQVPEWSHISVYANYVGGRIPPNDVPAPGTMVLAGTALLAFGLRRRKT